jgi:hypothetical protein
MAIDHGGRKSKDEPADLEEMIEYLEGRVDRLKVLYEQYFMGIEKMEPQTARKECERKILELTQMNMRNTALRYRFNALNQKWGVYRTYWNRTLREIERGTYLRSISRVGREAVRRGEDIPAEVLRAMPEKMRERIIKERALVAERVAKAGARKAERSAAAAPAPKDTQPDGVLEDATKPSLTPAPVPPGDDDFDSLFEKMIAKPPAPTPTPPPAPPRATTPTPTPPPRTPPPAPRLPPGMDDRQVQDLYKRYIQAKRLVGEDASRIKVENLVATINAQAPKIMNQYQAKAVEFSVVVKDNKVILKATPKK